MPKPSIFVSGASGFVGQRLVMRLLLDKKYTPIAATRRATQLQGLCPTVSFDMDNPSHRPDLNGVDAVVHSAARVHVMNELAEDALAEYRKVNVEGTLRLAKQAAEAGVRRFIFISSIKVNGESTRPGKPFSADDTPAPQDPYGVSKYEAEQALKQLALETSMELVIIRPPLVYGPGVKANFLNMLRWLDRGVPLPLGGIRNQRSLVALGNLVDFIVTCINHPAAANQTFLVSDGRDLSTPQLLNSLANALDKRSRLIALPEWLILSMATLLGKQAIASRVCGSLQVDISKNYELLGWTPPIHSDRAMRQTAIHYQENIGKAPCLKP
ncbi:UDP-glucose 4-epimerase family protein [Pseudomonas kribbensis]|uniref:UDP-glucose 4-epimerase family protein n=1 Tax=Pseudomonas kribbensis TaxID=1628086 RepID=UPI003D779250